jgi:hypothetical protein
VAPPPPRPATSPLRTATKKPLRTGGKTHHSHVDVADPLAQELLALNDEISFVHPTEAKGCRGYEEERRRHEAKRLALLERRDAVLKDLDHRAAILKAEEARAVKKPIAPAPAPRGARRQVVRSRKSDGTLKFILFDGRLWAFG